MKGFSVKHHGRALAVVVVAVICALGIVPATATGESANCAVELDRAVSMDSNGESERARRLFETLDSRCENYPQVAHNLGVLAGRANDWDAALQHFERAIAADQRAAMSLEHLRQIHRYHAGLAWRQALDASLDPSAVSPAPELRLQDSTVLNSDSIRPSTLSSELRTISTVEYELFDWWQNAASNNRTGWLAHYSRGFTAPEPTQLAQFKWDELQLRISLTRYDAVAIVNFPEPSKPGIWGALMLLRLEGNRWKIYEQSTL